MMILLVEFEDRSVYFCNVTSAVLRKDQFIINYGDNQVSYLDLDEIVDWEWLRAA